MKSFELITPVLIVAHRGESFLAPENTMVAFDLAWRLGDAAIELDIHLTGDGEIVVCHDVDTLRTSGYKRRVVLKDATLDEIQRIDVGSFKGSEFAGQHCPALREVFDAMPLGKKCYVELKSGIDVVPEWIEFRGRSGKASDEIVVISFQTDALAASKKAMPELNHHFLAECRPGRPGIEEFIAAAKHCGADGLDLAANESLTEANCKQVIAAGLELHVWATDRVNVGEGSVDDPKVARKYAEWGAKSITTNRAAMVRQNSSFAKML